MNIKQMLSNNKNHYAGVNNCKYITIHETGNKSKGAGALNHANYINNGSPTTWHFTVDDKQVIQHFKETTQCWHCGDGRGQGNTNSIGIEMCVNSDGNFNKTIENTIELVKHLMKVHNIPINNVVQHNKWSGKNCPQSIRNGVPMTWKTFIDRIGSVDTKTLYRVQIGAYSNKQNAINMQNELKKLGYNSFIVEGNK